MYVDKSKLKPFGNIHFLSIWSNFKIIIILKYNNLDNNKKTGSAEGSSLNIYLVLVI